MQEIATASRWKLPTTATSTKTLVNSPRLIKPTVWPRPKARLPQFLAPVLLFDHLFLHSTCTMPTQSLLHWLMDTTTSLPKFNWILDLSTMTILPCGDSLSEHSPTILLFPTTSLPCQQTRHGMTLSLKELVTAMLL